MEMLEQRITSVELCKIINELRREEKGESTKELLHKDFMKKIRKEVEILENMGIKDGGNFSLISYTDEMNREKPCYSLNASAMRQMLNSESAYVRYKTEKYIEKLENENKLLKEQKISVKSIEEQTKDCLLQIFNGGLTAIEGAKKLSEIQNKELIEENKELKPKADYTDEVLQSNSLISSTQIAKDFGLSAKKLNQILAEQKMQYKQGKQWLLYAKYQDKGYAQSTTFTDNSRSYMTTKWTEKGRRFIVDLLLKLGYKLSKNIN